MFSATSFDIDFRLADFDDVEMNLVVRVALHVALQLLDVGALLADDDARTRRVDRDAALLVRTLDDDARHAGLLQPFAQMLADLDVFLEQLAVFLLAGDTTCESQVRLTPRRKPIGLTF